MKVGIFGSKSWDDYMDLVRQITLFIQESHELGHDNIVFVHTSKPGAEIMLTEYIGKTQKFLKQKKFVIKEEIVRSAPGNISDINIIESGIDFAIVFSTKDKKTSVSAGLLKAYEIPHRIIENA